MKPLSIVGAVLLAVGCACGPQPDIRSTDAYERYLGAVEIGRNRDAAGYFVLVKMLKDPDPMARIGAVIGVASLNREKAAKDILPMLDDPDANVRSETVRWLGKLGNPVVLPALLKTLSSDASVDVRRTTALTLAHFSDREETVKALVAALGDPSAPVSFNAHQSLCKAFQRRDLPRSRVEFETWMQQNKPGGP